MAMLNRNSQLLERAMKDAKDVGLQTSEAVGEGWILSIRS